MYDDTREAMSPKVQLNACGGRLEEQATFRRIRHTHPNEGLFGSAESPRRVEGVLHCDGRIRALVKNPRQNARCHSTGLIDAVTELPFSSREDATNVVDTMLRPFLYSVADVIGRGTQDLQDDSCGAEERNTCARIHQH